MKYEVHLPCVPPKATHQGSAMIMKRKDGTSFVGKAHNSAGAKAKRNLLNLLCWEAPPKPFDCAVAVDVDVVFPWRKSEPKKNRALGSMPHVTKPDLDNYAKLLLDALCEANYITRDQLIHKLVMTKSWGDNVGITIRICDGETED